MIGEPWECMRMISLGIQDTFLKIEWATILHFPFLRFDGKMSFFSSNTENAPRWEEPIFRLPCIAYIHAHIQSSHLVQFHISFGSFQQHKGMIFLQSRTFSVFTLIPIVPCCSKFPPELLTPCSFNSYFGKLICNMLIYVICSKYVLVHIIVLQYD